MRFFICLAILEAAMAAASGRRATASEQEIRIEARDPVNSDSTNCRVGDFAWANDIRAQIPIIEGNGDAVVGPGWGNCRRLTCSNDSAVFLCNDSDHEIRIPGRIVTDNVKAIYGRCTTGPAQNPSVRGQIFSFDSSWNVIIKKDSC